MKKTLAALSVLTLFLNMDSPIYAEEEQKVPETEQVIVTMEENADRPLTGGEVIPVEGNEENQLVSVEVPEDETIDEFIEELEKRSDVEKVEKDHLIKLEYTANDPFINGYQYHHKKLETNRAWDKSRGSADIVVAVIDDGADIMHPDLVGQIFSPYDVVAGRSAPLPAGEHGTHISGIIGASIDNRDMGAGIAPKTRIMPVNVFDGEYAFTSDVIAGITYAVEHGADIINMSLGSTDYTEAFDDAVQQAYKSGVVIVAAAGNDGVSTPNYPAAYANVISVGSTTSTDTLSSFSNYGSTVDITAPGSSIYSTLPNDTFGRMSGTSMATPVVAGVAALVKAHEPKLTNAEIAKRLYTTAKDLGTLGKDNYFGNGRVSAKAALMIRDLAVPTIKRVYNYSAAVTGSIPYAITNAKVTIKNKAGSVVGSGTGYSGPVNFSIPVAPQPADSFLYVTVSDSYGNVSKPLEVRVTEDVPPAKPEVNNVTDQSTAISGTAEAQSTVTIKNGATVVATATATAEGTFTVGLPKQKAGTRLSVTATDASTNISPAEVVTVIDVTAPSAPAAVSLYSNAISITGQAESNASVFAYAGSTKIGEATAVNGAFNMAIPKQPIGASISLYAVDAAGNQSTTASARVANASVIARPSAYDKLKVYWSQVMGATGYEIYRSTASTGTYSRIAAVIGSSLLSYENTGLATGQTYYYKVRAYRTINGVKVYGGYSSIGSAKPVLAGITLVKAVSSGYSQNKISWSQVSGASGYRVYRAATANGTYSRIKTVTSGSTLSHADLGLTTGKTYYYKVRAYRQVGESMVFGAYSSIVSSKPSVSSTSVKAAPAGYSQNKLTWSQVTGASGYAVYRSLLKTGTYSNIKTIGSGSTLSFINLGLTAGKTYHYKVRAYRSVNGIKYYGPYSGIASAIPALAKPSSISAAKASATAIKTTWTKAAEAEGYELYRAASSTGIYSKIKTVIGGSSLSYTNSGLTAGRAYYYKVRAYRVVNGIKIYSAFSSIVSSKL